MFSGKKNLFLNFFNKITLVYDHNWHAHKCIDNNESIDNGKMMLKLLMTVLGNK